MKRQFVLRTAVFLALLLILTSFASAQEKRVALVVGNADYSALQSLRNPQNDAEDMAAALRRAGFEVILVVNADLQRMEEAVRDFSAALSDADVGLFYYAGHGVQSEGINYLVPVDADVRSETELRFKTLNADFVLEYMKAAETPFNMVILDACRDNPFSTSRSANRGLAVLPAPRGSLIAYATSPGDVAEDGAGENGTFTAAILDHILTPGIDVKEVFDRVGMTVTTQTANRQVPWVLTSYFGRFSFVEGDARPNAQTAPRPAGGRGTVEIIVDTNGALFVDGIERDAVSPDAPLRLDLPVGERVIEVRYSDSSERKVVEVEASQTETLRFAYAPDSIQTRNQGDRASVLYAQFDELTAIDRSGWEQGRPGGSLVMAASGWSASSLNPYVATNLNEREIHRLLHGSLIRRSPLDLEWEPHLAESYTVSEDSTVATFVLRPGLRWSDGTQITADDFVFSVEEVYANADSGYAVAAAFYIDGERVSIEAPNDRTVVISTPRSYAGILELGYFTPLPRHIFAPVLERDGYEGIAALWSLDDAGDVVTSGPYVPAEGTGSDGSVFRFVPNRYYYERDESGRRLPYLDELTLRLEPAGDDVVGGIVDGSVDVGLVYRENIEFVLDRLSEFDVLNAGPAAGTQFIAFNMNRIDGAEDRGLVEPQVDWLNNRTFRIAMAHLVDRRRLIDNAGLGYALPQYSPVWTQSPYYWPEAEFVGYAYNPERATTLLDSIDFVDRDKDGVREDPEGNPIILEFQTNDNNDRIATMNALAEEAETVGIRLETQVVPFAELVADFTQNYDWEMAIVGLTGSIDPISAGNVLPSWGDLHLVDPLQDKPARDWESIVDEAWNAAAFTVDEDERRRNYRIIQQTWTEEVPWIFTYNDLVTVAAHGSVGNVQPRPPLGYRLGTYAHRLFYR